MRKRNIITIISSLIAVLFTAYIVLDTFVIPHVYVVVDNKTNVSAEEINDSEEDEKETDEAETVSSSEPVITDIQYADDNISITLETVRVNDTDVYIADIVVSSPEYLKTAFAQSAYGKNVTETTSAMAEENNAILAINGDYYGVQEAGYVIRSGVLYRDTKRDDQQDLVIYQDGSMEVINEDDITAEELAENGAVNVLSFGPGLIEDGEITVSADDEVDKAKTSNPRTAIGIIDDLHYIFVVADGRTDESAGLSLLELAELMKSEGAVTAYNLDGGGSSTMVFNGRLVNNPSSSSNGKSRGSSGSSASTSGSERKVSDIVYIGY